MILLLLHDICLVSIFSQKAIFLIIGDISTEICFKSGKTYFKNGYSLPIVSQSITVVKRMGEEAGTLLYVE